MPKKAKRKVKMIYGHTPPFTELKPKVKKKTKAKKKVAKRKTRVAKVPTVVVVTDTGNPHNVYDFKDQQQAVDFLAIRMVQDMYKDLIDNAEVGELSATIIQSNKSSAFSKGHKLWSKVEKSMRLYIKNNSDSDLGYAILQGVMGDDPQRDDSLKVEDYLENRRKKLELELLLKTEKWKAAREKGKAERMKKIKDYDKKIIKRVVITDADRTAATISIAKRNLGDLDDKTNVKESNKKTSKGED